MKSVTLLKLRRVCYIIFAAAVSPDEPIIEEYSFTAMICFNNHAAYFDYAEIAAYIRLHILCEGEQSLGKSKKRELLKNFGLLNPHPDQVTDSDFLERDFFDADDLLQVKYEMIRKIEREGMSITEAASRFGFSRLSVYRIRSLLDEGGLSGLVPSRRGPKGGHKLTTEVMKFVERELERDPSMRARKLKDRIEEQFGMDIHVRSIERALNRKKKRDRHGNI